MSPSIEQIRIPAGLTLTVRPTCQPQVDERPTVRTRDGRVLAQVDAWRPDLAAN